MISKQELQQGINDIPPLSPVVVDVLDFLNSSDEVDFSILESKIIQEPGLTGRILNLSNSSFFGMPGAIGSLKDACLVLGINAIRNLVISSAMMEKFPSNSGKNLDLEGLWKHAVGTAAAAKVLAKHVHLDEEQAFTAGLLHDIGKMILDAHFSEQYAKVIAYQEENECLIGEAEEKIIGTDHSEVGAMVAESWNLPAEITNSISLHHSPQFQNKPEMFHLINLADILSRGLAIGNAGDPFIPVLLPEILEILHIDFPEIKQNLTKIEALAENFSSLLD